MRPSNLRSLLPAAAIAVLLIGPTHAAPAPAPAPAVDGPALARVGDDLYAKGAYAEALKRFEAALASGYETGPMLYEAAACYRQAMNNKDKEMELKRRALPLLEKESAAGSATADTYYYLAAIYINDLTDPVKGTEAAKKGVALLEKKGTPAPAGQVPLFRAGRLYSFLGKDKEAAGFYERSVAAAEGAAAADRPSLVLALESLSSSKYHAQDYAGAAKAYEALLKLDPLRDHDRHQLGLAYLMDGKPEEAAAAWRSAQEDELRTELTYLAAVIRKYVAAGSPKSATGLTNVAALSDDALAQKLLKAAEPLRAAREKEAKEQQEAEDRAEKERVAKEAAEKAAKPTDLATIKANIAKIKASKPPAPPPDPNSQDEPPNTLAALGGMGIHPVTPAYVPPPPSIERIGAEKDFFFLLVEYVKRGHLIRNFCFENGLVEMIFR